MWSVGRGSWSGVTKTDRVGVMTWGAGPLHTGTHMETPLPCCFSPSRAGWHGTWIYINLYDARETSNTLLCMSLFIFKASPAVNRAIF
ncbi:hypothetical protein FKM82_007340 [Ascaphus truei]